MAISSILNIQQIAENASNKHITHNDAIDALAEATNNIYNNAAVGAGPINLTDGEAVGYFVYRLSGASGAFNLVFPAVINSVNAKRVFSVRNEDTADVMTVKASTGAGAQVTIQPGTVALIAQDYQDMYILSIGSATTTPYDVGFFVPSKPTAAGIVLQFSATRAITLPGNLSGARGYINVNPTATMAFDVQKNGSTVGSISISTGGVFTFTTSGGTAVSLAAGDRLTIIAPSPQDATGSDVNVNIAATRSLL